jgi:hypothetical protein
MLSGARWPPRNGPNAKRKRPYKRLRTKGKLTRDDQIALCLAEISHPDLRREISRDCAGRVINRDKLGRALELRQSRRADLVARVLKNELSLNEALKIVNGAPDPAAPPPALGKNKKR